MNEFNEVLAKLKQRREGTPVDTPPHRQPELRDNFSRAELDTLLQRMSQQNEQITALTRAVAELTGSFDYRVAEAVKAELRKNADQVRDPHVELPNLSDISKMEIQRFDNTGQKKMAQHQLKLYAWTTPISKHSEDRCGTIGRKLIPIYEPNTALARKRFGNRLDYLTTDQIKLIGCLLVGQKFYDQGFAIDQDDRLYVCIRGQLIECGVPAKTTDRRHWESFPIGKRPSLMTWYWNVNHGQRS